MKETTRKDYEKKLNLFYDFVAFHELPIGKENDLDVALSDYADFLYLSGEDSNSGQKLQAALEFW